MDNNLYRVIAIRNDRESFYPVSTPLEAKKLIFQLAMADLEDDSIDYNMFDLLVWNRQIQDWQCWEDEAHNTIDEAFEEDEKTWLEEYRKAKNK